jgi:hypothetical protein
MRIHDMNPNIESDVVYAAQRTQAKREAEVFRKKLSASVAGLAAGNENCVLSISAQENNADDQSKQENQQEEENKQEKEDAKQDKFKSHISDWA